MTVSDDPQTEQLDKSAAAKGRGITGKVRAGGRDLTASASTAVPEGETGGEPSQTMRGLASSPEAAADSPCADRAGFDEQMDTHAAPGNGEATDSIDVSRVKKSKDKKKKKKTAAAKAADPTRPAAPDGHRLPTAPDTEAISPDPAGPTAEGTAPRETAPGPVTPTAAPKKRTKNGADDDGKPLGTSKAVETMFRNAVRAELDIIALAATKANIMISLNGFIISALMISGAFLFNSSPGFLFPAGVFLLTSAASIVFALLAASPERADLIASIWTWGRDVVARRARLRDIRDYVMRGRDARPADELNLLIYEDRVRMTRDEHWDRMQALLRDRDGIYHRMTDQLYWLGQMANHKFKLLNVSYTVFRWGLLASVLTFFTVKSTVALFPGLSGERPVRLQNLGIAEFSDIYEPSAVQQLPDGRILVVEDEAKRAVSVMTLAEDGSLVEDSTADLRLTRAFGRKLSDLEGLSIDQAENIYAITSHSATAKGERSPDREQLLRFRISGSNVGDIASVTNLRDALAGDAVLAEALRGAAGEPVDMGKLNIEGLAFHQQTGQLLLGLRAPKAGDRSIIIPIRNPGAMFDEAAAPDFGAPILLDLQDGGIRALSFDPVLGAFLIVNEIEGDDDNKVSQLWTWSGDPAVAAEPIALPEIINLNNVESIDSVMVHGEPRLLIMSDEGDPKKNRPAKYMMLDYGQLGG